MGIRFQMKYTKSPISVEEQIDKLEKRGLIFSDKNSAGKYLTNIGCYRLKAYTYPFQNNTDPEVDNVFRNDIYFEDIIDLYVFDRRLRNLISLLNDRHRLLTLKEMGFPADWEKLPVWKNQ